MELDELRRALIAEGYSLRHETSKVEHFKKGSTDLYVKKAGTDRPLVVHGRYGPRVAGLEAIQGVHRQKPVTAPYHNIHMTQFGLRMNKGLKPTRYGYDFGFDTSDALKAFLAKL